MPLSDSAHLMRDRAESFGSVAQQYDRYRPSYPTELVDDLVELAAGAPVLDIGTGTGKAGRLLVERGLDVVGVEIDPLMAEVAGSHGVAVETASFEDWPDAGRTFGLVISAQAWHWVQPQPGAAKVGRVLRPGAAFTPFWNFEELADDERAVAVEVYRELAPEILPTNVGGQNRPQERPYIGDLQASGVFAGIETRTYRWATTIPVEHWVNRVATHSDHISLGPERLDRLQASLTSALRGRGPEIHTEGGTYMILARTAS